MKITSIQTKLGILTTVACVGMSTPAHAVVTWVVSENLAQTEVTMSTDGGTLNLGSYTLASSFNLVNGNISNTSGVIQNGASGVELVYVSFDAGTHEDTYGNSGWVSTQPGAVSGDTFGQESSTFYWDPVSHGLLPTSITPDSTMTFPGKTIADIFGTSLSGGPVTVWTAKGTGDTIQVSLTAPLVPEPSSTALLGLGGLALMLRRRR